MTQFPPSGIRYGDLRDRELTEREEAMPGFFARLWAWLVRQ